MTSAIGVMVFGMIALSGPWVSVGGGTSYPRESVASSPEQKPADSRLSLGQRYADAFSDNARGRQVSWDDATCTLIDRAPDTGRPDVHATQLTTIPIVAITVDARQRGPSRMGTLDATFRCASPSQACMSRVHKYGETVVSAEQIGIHVMSLRGSVGDVPQLIADLATLQRACTAKP